MSAAADAGCPASELLRDQSWRPRMAGKNPARDAVAQTIRERIADGTYPPGSLLPALKVLADEHHCSQTPVSMARQLLAREGLVRLERNRGCRVRPAASDGRPALREGLLLDALRWAWDGVYQVSVSGGRLEAWRTDGTGSVLADTPQALREAIREDWPKYAAGTAL